MRFVGAAQVWLGLLVVVAPFHPTNLLAQQQPIRIVAPAAPGGGWDQLARTIQRVIEAEGLAPRVTVDNAPGAAGTVGLARFVSAERGEGNALLVTGLVMVGGIVQNGSPVGLGSVTPIARLVGEWEVLAVPMESPYQTLGQLLDAFRANPGAVSWGGGSAGGTDQILVDLIARAVGVDPSRANYVAFSGGGETKTALLGAQVSVAVSGWGELADVIASGRARALAVSSGARLQGIDIPTLTELGVPVELANWRGVVAPPGLLPAERLGLIAIVERMAHSAAWKVELERRGWEPLYLSGDAFRRFLAAESERVEGLARLKRGEGGPTSGVPWLPTVAAAVLLIALGVIGLGRPELPHDIGQVGLRKVGLLLAGMVLDIVAVDQIGFIGASLVLFVLAAVAFGERPRRAVIVGAVYCAAVFAVFSWALEVHLPVGRLWTGR